MINRSLAGWKRGSKIDEEHLGSRVLANCTTLVRSDLVIMTSAAKDVRADECSSPLHLLFPHLFLQRSCQPEKRFTTSHKVNAVFPHFCHCLDRDACIGHVRGP